MPVDGARISVLKYEDCDLLTPEPVLFKPPEKFYGEYETRPVYGYDDCFPTVDPCIYPEDIFRCRDHGDLCWDKWIVEKDCNVLICSVSCANPAADFKRTMVFIGNELSWRFEVRNLSYKKLPFLHVMHALMPLENIEFVKLPGHSNLIDEINMTVNGLLLPDQLADHLIGIPQDKYEMLLLKDIKEGLVTLGFKSGLTLDISFDISWFPTLGIWWNNYGYPEEDGLRRTECAFEPIPGTSSDLSRSYSDGTYLSVAPGETLSWKISWIITDSKL